MLKRVSAATAAVLYPADLLFTLLLLRLAEEARFRLNVGMNLGGQGSLLSPPIYAVVAIIWTLLLFLFSVYDRRRNAHFLAELRQVTLSTVTATLVLAGVLYLSFRDVPRLLFLYFCVMDLVSLLGLRVLARLVLALRTRDLAFGRKVLVVGAGKVGCQVARALARHSLLGLQMVGFLDDDAQKRGQRFEGYPVLGRLSDAEHVARECGIDEVIFALPPRAHQLLVNLALELRRQPVQVWVVPDLFDLAFARTATEDLCGIPLIGLREPAIDGANRVLKRAFDLVVGGLGLLLCWPVMAAIAIAIRLDSPGPIFFSQERVGENGRIFRMIKFRSMVADAERHQSEVLVSLPDGKLVHKAANDHRVTRVGRWLRRTSLDELPQIINVLRGQMSLVGPRPEMPWLVDQYDAWQWGRFAVPQGMTGWWQVNGRSDRPMHLHTEDDLYYIQNYSLLLDLKILLKTAGVVFRGDGAF